MMKRLIIISVIVFTGLVFNVNAAQPYDYTGGTELFYSELAPFGTWIQLNNGLVVWRPLNLRPGWAPYKYGHWIWTNDGWYWHSNEPYGYIVFHYGRWYYDDYYGWLWVPDDVWAPAWVQWRYDNDYIGWAPLPPYASFSANFGIHFTMSFFTPYYRWHFVRYRYMCNPYTYNYYIPDRIKYRVFSATKYRTNYGYSNGRVINRGLDVDFIRKRSGARIIERSIDRVNSPRDIGNGRGVNGNSVRAYIVSRNRVSGDNLRNMDIRRGNRASSIDLSKIRIGDRNLIRMDNNSRGVNRNNYNDRTSRDVNPRGINTIPGRNELNPRDIQKRNERQIKKEWNRMPQINRNDGYRNERRIERSQPNRNYRPEIRRETRSRQEPQVRRENRSNNNRGTNRSSGHRIRR